MKELEVRPGLLVREDGMVKNITGHFNAKKGWHLGSNTGGYRNVKVPGFKSMQHVHRLVAKAFIPNPENKEQVNHINGVKNDNRVCNLEWNTAQENIQHAVATGLKVEKKGQSSHNAKLTAKDCTEIKQHLSEGKLNQREISELYGVSDYPIKSIKYGIHWSCK